ncbi:hypothetical protein FG386_000602 [Cryptosporidium ryanae]|uniref:uncharacterized protein n=1 Tax=Cryptosporidium ryanae TaxID=515981 RepID=UPI00351AA469|nr:hypothetical protein FG386_000602 [Cryptosporidium ryanae]
MNNLRTYKSIALLISITIVLNVISALGNDSVQVRGEGTTGDIKVKKYIIKEESEISDKEEALLRRIPGLEICEECDCLKSSYRNILSSTKSLPSENKPYLEAFTCGKCNINCEDYLSNDDCVSRVIKRDRKRALEHISYDKLYRTIFIGKSNKLTNYGIGNSLFGNIFEPIFEWKKVSKGSILDNCRLFTNGNNTNNSYFDTRYIYSIKTHGNCTLTTHFVNKYSGKVIVKNQYINTSKNPKGSSTLTLFSFDNIEIEQNIHKSINIHQEYNFTFYKVPHKYEYSKLNNKWVPTRFQKPVVELNPNLLLDYLFLIFQINGDNNNNISGKFCDIENVHVNLYVQCKPTIFSPNVKYSKKYVEKLLEVIYNEHKHDFNLFLENLEAKFKKTLRNLVPSALLDYEYNLKNIEENKSLNDENSMYSPQALSSPFGAISHSCKESLYLREIPEIMSKYGYNLELYDKSKLDLYLNSVDILEEKQENSLLDTIEDILDGNNTSRS